MEYLKNRLIIEFAENCECISDPHHTRCSSICCMKFYDMVRYVQQRLGYPDKNGLDVPEAKKRWECLVKQYLKELRRLSSAKKKYIKRGSKGEEPQSYWTYFEHMQYLDKYYRHIEENNNCVNTRSKC